MKSDSPPRGRQRQSGGGNTRKKFSVLREIAAEERLLLEDLDRPRQLQADAPFARLSRKTSLEIEVAQREQRPDSRRLSVPRTVFFTDQSPSPIRKHSVQQSETDSPSQSTKRVFPRSQAVLPQIKQQPSAFSPDRSRMRNSSKQHAERDLPASRTDCQGISAKLGSNIFKSSLQRLGAIDRSCADSRLRKLKDRVFVASIDLHDSNAPQSLKAVDRSPEKLSCSTFSPHKAVSCQSPLAPASQLLARKKSSKTSLFQIVTASHLRCDPLSADASPHAPHRLIASGESRPQPDDPPTPLDSHSRPSFVPVGSNAFGEVVQSLRLSQVSAANHRRRSDARRFEEHLQQMAAVARDAKVLASASTQQLQKLSTQGFLDSQLTRLQKLRVVRSKLTNARRKLLQVGYPATFVRSADQLPGESRSVQDSVSAEEVKAFLQSVKRQDAAAAEQSVKSNRSLIFESDSVAAA